MVGYWLETRVFCNSSPRDAIWNRCPNTYREAVESTAYRYNEVQYVIEHQLKSGKWAGPDGVRHSMFKLLPVERVIFLCTFMNIEFVLNCPIKWTCARLVMLFRKGNPQDCDNYRGISVINRIAKLYDYVLNNRLLTWYKPFQEQAGASILWHLQQAFNRMCKKEE